MIEQPLPRGGDEALEGYDLADSPVRGRVLPGSFGIRAAARRYQMINIKLDKTGGLTEALALARMAPTRAWI